MEAVSIDLALSDPVASFKPLACEIRALLSGDTTRLAPRPRPSRDLIGQSRDRRERKM